MEKSVKEIEKEATKGLKIIHLKTQNIKNIKCIEITPEGNSVILSGKNGAGKSAVLDSIFTTLTGKRLEEPIRRGEERGEVVVNLGDMEVKKVFTAKGEYLTVKPLYPGETAQQKLNELIGNLTFDPLAFSEMKSRDQLDLLKQLVGLTFDDLDDEFEEITTTRTALNRQIKESVALLKTIDPPDSDTPEKEISFRVALGELEILREKREGYLNAEIDILAKENELKENGVRLDTLKAEIVQLEQAYAFLHSDIRAYVIPPEVTVEQILKKQGEIIQIEDTNVKVRAKKRFNETIKMAEKRKQEADKLTEMLKRLELDKSTRIASCNFPIEKLGMNDDSVTYGAIPFGQLSTGQQIRISTAIGMALNPTLKVIFSRNASLLDKENLAEIIKMAEDNDYQIWLEICSDEGKTGIYIEDGSISK